MKTLFIAMAYLLFSPSVFAQDSRILTLDHAVSNADKVYFDVAVGEIEILPSQDNQVHIWVKVSKSEGVFNFFDGDVAHAKLIVNTSDDRVTFHIPTEDIKTKWRVQLPNVTLLDVNLGVGAVEIHEIKVNMNIDVGVGEALIYAQGASVKGVDADAGVGDASISGAKGGHTSRNGFVGGSAVWRGKGEINISVNVGVGSADIQLR